MNGIMAGSAEKEALVAEIRQHISRLDQDEHEMTPGEISVSLLRGKQVDPKFVLMTMGFRILFTRLRHPAVGLYRQISVSRLDGRLFGADDQTFFQSVFERSAGTTLASCGLLFSNRMIQAVWA